MSLNLFYNIENPVLIGYEYAWVTYFNSGEIPPNIIAPEIIESWNRCKKRGQSELDRDIPRNICTPTALNRLLKERKYFIEICEPILRGMIDVLKMEYLDLCITDEFGTVLMVKRRGDDQPSLVEEGENLNEEYVGTDCTNLALRLRRPVSVVGAEHYYQEHHKYACYGAPLISGDDMIGTVSVFTKLEFMSDSLLSVVVSAAKAIENGIELHMSNQVISRQNSERNDILNSVTDGIIYVDTSLTITHANSRFAKLSGITVDDLIGSPISVVNMVPHINTLMSASARQKNFPVKLKGKSRVYNCLLDHRMIENSSGEENELLVFTSADEVQEMAETLQSENRAYLTFDDIIGSSKELLECIELAKRVADYGARALLEGESGTGKEVFAQSIHNRSVRQDGPFVAVDCGAIPHELLESEIFGYEEGAYTGARKGGRSGKFELAHNGTLFLDEIGNLTLDMQAKLLRVLQDSRVIRIGGNAPVQVDVQIIAATNQNLMKEIECGNFREDLYYRLNVVHIKIPPLRNRTEDIPLLVRSYIRDYQQRSNVVDIDKDVLDIFMHYNWPGNVRQLFNVLERMVILTDGSTLTRALIPDKIAKGSAHNFIPPIAVDKIDTLDAISKHYVHSVLDELHGNVSRAAQALGISRATVYKHIRGTND